MKRCPKCGFETADEEMNFCPHCSYEDGNGPVELITESTKASSSVNTVKSAHPGKGDEIHSKEDVARVKSSIKTPADSADISGDANAVNIHGDVIKTNDDHATYNISNTTKELTEAEKLRDSETTYFNECVRLIHDGFIDDDGQRQLNAMQISLGLNKDRADSIQKNVTAQSIRKRTGLNITVVNLISSAKRSIELNDRTRLLTILKELEAYRGQYDDDNLDHIYFQLKAILSPDAYVKDFTSITTSYWETFWSYIPLLRIDIKKATESLATLERWGYFYPSQNQSVLQTVGLLIQNRLLEARETFNSVVPGYSENLEPICFSIRELLDKHWDVTTDVSPRAKFYVDALFKSAYTSIMQEAKDRNADEIAAGHEAEIAAKAIQNKKDNFIIKYEEKKGSIYDALVLAGVTQLQFDEWKRVDANFKMALDAIDKRIDENRINEEKKISELKQTLLSYLDSKEVSLSDALMELGITQEQFSEWTLKDSIFLEKYKEIEDRQRKRNEELLQLIKIQKDKFLALYKSNKCDIQKTCSELGLTPGVINEWREQDGAFNNSISYIKREFDKKRNRKFFSTVIACILILVLSAIIISHIRNTHQKNEQAEQNYNELLLQFNEKYANVHVDDEGATALEDSYTYFSKIKAYKDSLGIPSDTQFATIKDKICRKCDELIDFYSSKAIPLKKNLDSIKQESKKYLELTDRVDQIWNLIEEGTFKSVIDLDDFYTAVAAYEKGDFAKATGIFESCKSKFGDKYIPALNKWIQLCNDKIDEQEQELRNSAERKRRRENNGYVYVSPCTISISGQTFDIAAVAQTALSSKQYKCIDDLGQSLYSIYFTANTGETRYIKEENRYCSSINVIIQIKNSISGVILNTINIKLPLESTDAISVKKAYQKLQSKIEDTVLTGLKN